MGFNAAFHWPSCIFHAFYTVVPRMVYWTARQEIQIQQTRSGPVSGMESVDRVLVDMYRQGHCVTRPRTRSRTHQTVSHNGSLTRCYLSQWKTPSSKSEWTFVSLPLLGLDSATLRHANARSRPLSLVPWFLCCLISLVEETLLNEWLSIIHIKQPQPCIFPPFIRQFSFCDCYALMKGLCTCILIG